MHKREDSIKFRSDHSIDSAQIKGICDGLIWLDTTAKVIEAELAASSLFVHEQTMLIGTSLLDWLAEPSRESARELITEFLASEASTLSLETAIKQIQSDVSQRAPIYLHLSKASYPAPHIVVAVTDLSDLKTTVAQSRLAKFSVDKAGEAIFWIDEDANFKYVNETACQRLGYTEQQLLGMKVFDIDAQMTSEIWPEHWQALKQQRQLTVESTHKSSDGHEFPVEVLVNYVEYEGRVYNFAFARDISSKQIAEKRMRESELRKAAILEVALDCIITIDEQGKVIDFNRAAEETFGYQREALIGKDMAGIIVPPALREAHLKGMDTFRKTGEGPVLGKRLELPALHADGHEFPIEIAIHPIKLEDKQIFTAYLRDISERKDAERQLELAKVDAEKANQAKSAFLAKMSHEIRTPMTAIVGYSDLLSRPKQKLIDIAQWSQLIQKNANYLLALVNDILDLSKIEAGEMPLHITSVDPIQMVQDALALFQDRAREKLVDLELTVFGEIPEAIDTDGRRLKQILINLLSNAIKFTDKGFVRIHLEGSIKNHALIIHVQDTGLGISDELLPRLFDHFTQEEKINKNRSGTGLGLAICQQLASAMGSEITVQTQAGKGSDFKFELKLPADNFKQLASHKRLLEAQSQNSLPETRDAEENKYDLSDLYILAVDDNEDNLRIISYLLNEAGAEVVTASDGLSALALAKEANVFDLVLMDMQMPVMNGYDATRKLREFNPELPVIALTAFAMVDDKKKCLDAGCNDYLSKPIIPESLIEKIAIHTGKRAAEIQEDSQLETQAESETKAQSSADEALSTTPDDSKANNEPLTPLVSTMKGNTKFEVILNKFMEGLPQTEALIHQALKDDKTDDIKVITHKLRGTAANYGFPQITEVAGQIENQLRTGSDLKTCRPDIESLITLLKRTQL